MKLMKEDILKRKAFGVIAAILIMVFVAVMGVTVMYLMRTDTLGSLNYEYSQRAFFTAEGGLRYYVLKLKQQVSSWVSPPAPPINEPLGEGTFTITLANAQDDDIDVTSTGYVTAPSGSLVKRVVRVHMKRIFPEAFEYATYADTNVNFVQDGTIEGDVAADQHVHGEDKWTINGNVEEGADIDFPYMDFPSYENDADYVEEGSFIFEEGKTYEGIYYIKKSAYIENGVTINGVVIAEQNISIKGKDINLTAKSGYPVLAAQLNIKINTEKAEESISINGLIYTEQNFILVSKGKTDLHGSVVAKDNVDITSQGSTTITYDPAFLVLLPYFSSTEKPTKGWDEIY